MDYSTDGASTLFYSGCIVSVEIVTTRSKKACRESYNAPLVRVILSSSNNAYYALVPNKKMDKLIQVSLSSIKLNHAPVRPLDLDQLYQLWKASVTRQAVPVRPTPVVQSTVMDLPHSRLRPRNTGLRYQDKQIIIPSRAVVPVSKPRANLSQKEIDTETESDESQDWKIEISKQQEKENKEKEKKEREKKRKEKRQKKEKKKKQEKRKNEVKASEEESEDESDAERGNTPIMIEKKGKRKRERSPEQTKFERNILLLEHMESAENQSIEAMKLSNLQAMFQKDWHAKKLKLIDEHFKFLAT